MSDTRDCSICDDLLDITQHPELHVGKWLICEICWYKMQDYLTARGFTMLQEGKATLRSEIEKIVAHAKTKTPCASHYECLMADLLGALRSEGE